MGQRDGRSGATPSVLTRVVRDAVAFDTSGLAPIAGLRAAVGLTAALAIGLAAGGPAAAVIAAVGALVIGIVSLTGGVRPPLLTMALTALAQATSIFVGSVTGQIAPLHIAVLAGWAFAAGLFIALGRGATTVGLQGIVAFVVFGRFTETPVGAARLAGIALAGAAFQLIVTGVVRWPEALRAQRAQLAATFRQLAVLARGTPDAPGVPSAEAADAAEQLLTGISLLARDDGRAMRGLLDEARRLRLALLSLAGLRRRMTTAAGSFGSAFDEVLHDTADVLDGIATSLKGRDESVVERLREQTAHLSERGRALSENRRDPSPVTTTAADVAGALAGQLRAALALVEEIWKTEGTSLRLPSRLHHRDRGWVAHVRSDVAQLQANLSPESGAFRHAMRMAVAVPTASAVGQYTPLGRGYWIPLTVAVVLRPDFSGTFTIGVGRALGTSIGVAIAGLAVATLHPGTAVSIVAIGLLAWAAYALFGASYAAFIAGLTAIIVLLLGLITPDTIDTAIARLVDTLIGGAFALAAYAAWPTWSAGQGWTALGDLVTAQRRYLHAIFCRITGNDDPDEASLARLARQARLARSNASAVVDRASREPSRYRIDTERTSGVLAALRRVSDALHLLRTRAADAPGSVSAAAPLASAMDSAMATLAASLRGEAGQRSLPPLRQLHDQLRAEADASDFSRLAVAETDEIVDALDTVGHLLGLVPANAH